MAPYFKFLVSASRASDNEDLFKNMEYPVTLEMEYDPEGLNIRLLKDYEGTVCQLYEFSISRNSECSRVGKNSFVIYFDTDTVCIRFANPNDLKKFYSLIHQLKDGKGLSAFSQRTDESSAIQYFQFYGYLSQQQNMLQDYVRTGTYQRAISVNSDDFKDKVVLDVGAGSGILSFFAANAGARAVYAVEASTMAKHAENLVSANNLENVIKVVAGKIEEINLPELVDVIISEPMGYMLYNERMLETFLHAKKWLKPGGIMFPSKGDLHIAPFMDESLYYEQVNKANFWVQKAFHGVDLSCLRDAAMKEYFRQPIVDTFDIRICLAKSIRHSVDFNIAHETDLHRIDIPLEFHIFENGTIHGLAFWFDVAFAGSLQTVWLSTAPTEALTHWYQVRCLIETPIFAKVGHVLTGFVSLQANQRQSYDITVELSIEGCGGIKSRNVLDLKNPYFRYSGQPINPPPGFNTTSPSEAYWTSVDGQNRGLNLLNGISVNCLGEVSLEAIHQPSPNLTTINTSALAGSTGSPRQRNSFGRSTPSPVAGIISPPVFSSQAMSFT